jgi:hypothetical protein
VPADRAAGALCDLPTWLGTLNTGVNCTLRRRWTPRRKASGTNGKLPTEKGHAAAAVRPQPCARATAQRATCCARSLRRRRGAARARSAPLRRGGCSRQLSRQRHQGRVAGARRRPLLRLQLGARRRQPLLVPPPREQQLRHPQARVSAAASAVPTRREALRGPQTRRGGRCALHAPWGRRSRRGEDGAAS